eukprot:370165-Pyramimonas_sp.AAC.1
MGADSQSADRQLFEFSPSGRPGTRHREEQHLNNVSNNRRDGPCELGCCPLMFSRALNGSST